MTETIPERRDYQMRVAADSSEITHVPVELARMNASEGDVWVALAGRSDATASEVADDIDYGVTTVHKSLGRLEDAGLVTRLPYPQRPKRWTATAAGVEVLEL